ARGLGISGQWPEPPPGEGPLDLAAVPRFVDEQEIADEQGVLHARAGDAESFNDIRAQPQPDRDRHDPGPAPSAQLVGNAVREFHGFSTQSAMKMLVS